MLPRITCDEFFGYFPEDRHAELHARLTDHGRLIAWGGAPSKRLPIYVIPQALEGSLGNQWDVVAGPASGYDRILFYCERSPDVLPYSVVLPFLSSPEMNVITPLPKEPWAEWLARLEEEGESLNDCSDLLLRAVVNTLSEGDWVWKNRNECIDRIGKLIYRLTEVLEELHEYDEPYPEEEDNVEEEDPELLR